MKKGRRVKKKHEVWNGKRTLIRVGTLNIGPNDWNGERAGRHDGAKEFRCTVPSGNKVEREKNEKHWRLLQTILQRS